MGGAKGEQFDRLVCHLRVVQGKSKQKRAADHERHPGRPGIIVSNIHSVVMYRGMGWRWCIV